MKIEETISTRSTAGMTPELLVLCNELHGNFWRPGVARTHVVVEYLPRLVAARASHAQRAALRFRLADVLLREMAAEAMDRSQAMGAMPFQGLAELGRVVLWEHADAAQEIGTQAPNLRALREIMDAASARDAGEVAWAIAPHGLVGANMWRAPACAARSAAYCANQAAADLSAKWPGGGTEIDAARRYVAAALQASEACCVAVGSKQTEETAAAIGAAYAAVRAADVAVSATASSVADAQRAIGAAHAAATAAESLTGPLADAAFAVSILAKCAADAAFSSAHHAEDKSEGLPVSKYGVTFAASRAARAVLVFSKSEEEQVRWTRRLLDAALEVLAR